MSSKRGRQGERTPAPAPEHAAELERLGRELAAARAAEAAALEAIVQDTATRLANGEAVNLKAVASLTGVSRQTLHARLASR